MSQLRNMEIAEGFKRVPMYESDTEWLFALCRAEVDDDEAGGAAYAFEYADSITICPRGLDPVTDDSGVVINFPTYRDAHNALLNRASDSPFA